MDTASHSPYLFIGMLSLAAIGLGVAPLVLSRFVAPKKPGPTKQDAYECGLPSAGESWVQFRVQYYIYALLFVIFDVEVIFIYPWALAFYRTPGLVAVAELAIFVGILAVGLAYAWRKGVLEWE